MISFFQQEKGLFELEKLLHGVSYKQAAVFAFYFLVALGLRCCAWAFSSCGERGLLFIAVHGLLIAVASLVVEHGLQACGLSSCGSRALERRLGSCGTWAQLLRGMWDLPGLGLEPVSPALAGGFLTTAPPGKSLYQVLVTVPLQVDFLKHNPYNRGKERKSVLIWTYL